MPHSTEPNENKAALTAAGSYRALTAGERSLLNFPSGLLPSGEAGFAFIFQSGVDPITQELERSFNINYPSVGVHNVVVVSGLAYLNDSIFSAFGAASGIPLGLYPTYPSGGLQPGFGGAETGIFHPDELDTPFSNSKETKDLLDRAGITDFTIFNNYMHYYGRE